MLRLIESSMAALEHHLVLVAPPQLTTDAFNNVTADAFQRKQLIRDMQQLRGAIYLEEGNVKRHELTVDGRHRTPEDDKSWHILMTDGAGHIRSCALFLLHDRGATFDDLRSRHCPLVKDPVWRDKVTGAVQSEMTRAEREGLRFAELGGWAIQKERRGSAEGLMMALATYGLSQMLGGALGITTANVAHSCSAILRRLGGAFLEHEGTTIPAYFDPRYNTQIDLLRFDSRRPSSKYAHLIEMVKQTLASVTVVADALDFPQVDDYHHTVTDMARPIYAA